MATEVFTREEITLQNGDEIELRPLVIGKLRKFMKIWNDHIATVAKIMTENAEKDQPEDIEERVSDLQYSTFVQLCKFGLEELKGEKTEKQFTEYLENTLDEPTIYKILEATGGLRLGSQNLTLPGQSNLDPDGTN